MKILIIEDEYHAVKYLSNLIKEVVPTAQILETLDSVSDAVEWLTNNPAPDLIFMDIQLADGLSFSIFKKVKVTAPVIFTTAFDQYTLEAFKINSVDYLLKPIEVTELRNAIQKYQDIHGSKTAFNPESLMQLMQNIQQPKPFRQRFLIKQGKDFIYLPIAEVAYVYSEEGMTFLITTANKRHLLDTTLDTLEKEVDPNEFFRISRKQIVHISSVTKIYSYFNHRLKVELQPSSKVEAIVSRERVKAFKNWLDR